MGDTYGFMGVTSVWSDSHPRLSHSSGFSAEEDLNFCVRSTPSRRQAGEKSVCVCVCTSVDHLVRVELAA